ncbi:glutamine synthetase family protein [Pyrobaculum neutrophilum]|uniref:Glutamine synthetase catalytic region n=1 Tax=Pyrobaculum neutrophilum (strain DSM 2338 / JCM 9278 / NBRC 100436 / V24Sta) TaxID=444157 RepID=B1YC90_PYRNV|nr:glutamine synthetase family protein [Pyrobaculum neutrophilum]ACB39403.1 glutamine synthetase catalytic region [Pyrobaculum neutrophilum V24Sta]
MQVEGIDVWRVLKGAGVKYVYFVIVDIYGRPRVDIMPIDMAKDAFIDGVPYDGSSIPAYSTVNRSDFVAVVDPSAVYVESWNGGKAAYVFTNTLDGNAPSPLDPRNVLKQVLERAEKRGYQFKIGVEVEYFVVRGNPPELPEKAGYFDVPPDATRKVVEEIMENFAAAGLGETKTHHEVAPSQFEVNIPYGNPLKTADSILMFKTMARAVAAKHGYTVTFMPKPFWGMNGSGAHTHISVWKDGKNLMASVKEPTQELKWVVGGILNNAISISAIVAPTVNSYKRLVPHHEAPTRVVWGLGNRSAMVRVPYYGGKINRIEYRHPDPSMNPYLAFAAVVLAGLEGLENRIEPPPPVQEVAYDLQGVRETPPNLGAALKYMEEGKIARELPSDFVKAYLGVKQAEWQSYAQQYQWEKTWNTITPWEYEQYLTTV